MGWRHRSHQEKTTLKCMAILTVVLATLLLSLILLEINYESKLKDFEKEIRFLKSTLNPSTTTASPKVETIFSSFLTKKKSKEEEIGKQESSLVQDALKMLTQMRFGEYNENILFLMANAGRLRNQTILGLPKQPKDTKGHFILKDLTKNDMPFAKDGLQPRMKILMNENSAR